jgi:two-component system KDP operon response regulator KdpE
MMAKAKMTHVLIVDDDPKIRQLARVNLEERGYTVTEAVDGQEAIDQFKAEQPDLILLDLVMPGLSGIDVCIWVRAQHDIPIVVLSAYDEEDLKVRALDAGADDYVTKPFGYEELLARVRAVMRRAEGEAASEQVEKVRVGEFLIDLGARRAFVGGVDLQLTRTEFALLAVLAGKLDTVVSHSELLARVWGPEYRDASHYLYIYFGRIRKKIGEEYEDLLETVPGVGYMLHSEVPEKKE